MKCPKCGTDVLDLELRNELRLNRIILIAATVVIAITIIAAAIYAVGALKPKPELVGVIEVGSLSYYDDGSDGWYSKSCSGHIFNVGSIGCVAEVTVNLSDARGWSYETTIVTGWMPAGDTASVYFWFDVPKIFNAQEADIDGVKLNVDFRYLDSGEW